MAIIQYKCDTCNREINLKQNKDGLEVINKCIITDGCRGNLYQIDMKPDFVRGSLPSREIGLEDWTQRKVLFNYKQAVKLSKWNIKHNMGVIPIVQTYVERPKNIDYNSINLSLVDISKLVDLIEVAPKNIEIVDNNNIIIEFDRNESGIAQLIARSSESKIDNNKVVTESIKAFMASNDNILTIATKSDVPNITLTMDYTLSNGNVISQQYNIDDNPELISPWIDYNKVLINQQTYTVRSFNFVNNTPNIIDNTISNGTIFKITKLNNVDLQHDDIVILLSNTPNKTIDKIIDQVAYGILNGTNYYNNGELYIDNNNINQIYPYIKEV